LSTSLTNKSCKRDLVQTDKSGVDIREGELDGRLRLLFPEMPRGPFENFTLRLFFLTRMSHYIVLLKKLMNHSRATFNELWSKLHVFQDKAKVCANVPKNPSTTLMRRQRII